MAKKHNLTNTSMISLNLRVCCLFKADCFPKFSSKCDYFFIVTNSSNYTSPSFIEQEKERKKKLADWNAKERQQCSCLTPECDLPGGSCGGRDTQGCL